MIDEFPWDVDNHPPSGPICKACGSSLDVEPHDPKCPVDSPDVCFFCGSGEDYCLDWCPTRGMYCGECHQYPEHEGHDAYCSVGFEDILEREGKL